MPAVVRTERVVGCPLCGACRARPVCTARDRLHGGRQEFRYSQCRACGGLFQSVRPVEDDIAACYPDDYGPYQAPLPTVRQDGPGHPQGPHVPLHRGFSSRFKDSAKRVLGRLNVALARRRPDPLPTALDRFYAPNRPGQTLLDFGCGSAAFLNQARDQGWTTVGADFAAGAVEAVRRAGHRGLSADAALGHGIPGASVDAVRMNHVIEHLYHPHEVLAALRQKLRPGGRLHLATPNAACLTFRLLRARWFSLDCPRHIVVFSPATVRALLLKAGFTSVAVYQEVLTKDLARSLGYLLHDLGRLDAADVTGMADRAGWAALLFAPARLAALAGASDRLHAIAQA